MCRIYSSPFCTVSKVLIFGDSFVRRLKSDLIANFEQRASRDFGLSGSAITYMHGVGGQRTVPKLRRHDLRLLSRILPDIVILEIGTNDLSNWNPEVVGSEIEELVRSLLEQISLRIVGVCHVTPRDNHHALNRNFNAKALILKQYVRVVLEHVEHVFCWTHKGFANHSVTPFLSDGVHLNPVGQYNLYRSYRGAILTALSQLRAL